MIENGISLRLYRNCRISPNYKNVLSRTPINTDVSNFNSPFDEYLNTLTHYDLDLDLVYQDEITEFNFYLTTQDYSSIYNFNYMRIQSIKDNQVVLERYAFINSLTIKNDIAILKFKIDVWHSFIKSLTGINYAYLRGFRIIKNSPSSQLPVFDIYNLPLDYQGNDKVNLVQNDNITNRDLALILEIQEYDTSQLGNANWSWTRYCLLNHYYYDDEIKPPEGDNYHITGTVNLTAQNVDEFIQQIMLLSLKNYLYNGTAHDYFTIGKIYVVPNTNEIKSMFKSNNEEDIFIRLPTYEVIEGSKWEFRNYYIRSAKRNIDLTTIVNSSFNANFKRKSIGFYTKQFDIINNGTEINYEIKGFASDSSFKLYFNYQNQLIEITDLFEYQPVGKNLIDGATLTQHRLRYILQQGQFDAAILNWSANTVASLYSGGMNIGKMQTQMAANSSLTNQSLNLGNGFRTTNYANMYEQSAYNYNISQAGLVQDSNNALTGAFTLALKRATFEYPQYNYQTIICSNNNAVINANKWVMSGIINSDNDNFVKQIINYTGFEVYKFVSGILHTGLLVEGHIFTDNNIYYNVLQYKTIDCYGEFPTNIKLEIEHILTSGVRIFYSGTHFMEDDTYLENISI